MLSSRPCSCLADLGAPSPDSAPQPPTLRSEPPSPILQTLQADVQGHDSRSLRSPSDFSHGRGPSVVLGAKSLAFLPFLP